MDKTNAAIWGSIFLNAAVIFFLVFCWFAVRGAFYLIRARRSGANRTSNPWASPAAPDGKTLHARGVKSAIRAAVFAALTIGAFVALRALEPAYADGLKAIAAAPKPSLFESIKSLLGLQ